MALARGDLGLVRPHRAFSCGNCTGRLRTAIIRGGGDQRHGAKIKHQPQPGSEEARCILAHCCCCCSMRRDRVRASRHNSLLAQRFELAALLVDVSAHVGGNGLESRVAVQRLPEGIVIKGVPPLHVEP